MNKLFKVIKMLIKSVIEAQGPAKSNITIVYNLTVYSSLLRDNNYI